MARNGLPEEQVKAIMATQATRRQRLAAADDVIVNDGDIGQLAPQVERLHRLYLGFAERMPTIPPHRL
jgi:dephospho-CoA kinase